MYDLMIEKLVHSGLDTLVSASEIRSGIWLKDKKNFGQASIYFAILLILIDDIFN